MCNSGSIEQTETIAALRLTRDGLRTVLTARVKLLSKRALPLFLIPVNALTLTHYDIAGGNS
jgi:hypothetical protein